MEWYNESEIEDLVVPDHEHMFDWTPSQETWCPWDKLVESPRKITAVGIQEPMFSVTASSGDIEQIYTSKAVRPNFYQQTDPPSKYSFDHLNEFDIIDEEDDIFFHSILDQDSSIIDRADNSSKSFENEDVKPVHVSRKGKRARDHNETLTNFKKQSSSASVAFNPSFPSEQEFEFLDSYGHSDVHQHDINDDISVEECVLQELQKLTTQLASKTRICFRDAFYRLAEDSRPENSCYQNGDESHVSKESETNAIDRAVATLLFNQNEYQLNCCLSPPRSPDSSYCTISGGDREVPTFSLLANE